MGISSSVGIFSGLDMGALIDQLMSVERRPLSLLERQKTYYQVQISEYGSISGALSSLKNTLADLKSDKIYTYTAVSSDNSVFTVTADSTAAMGTYDIEVTNIAGQQSLYSESFTNSTVEVATDLATYPAQTLKIQVGIAAAVEVVITSDNNTLTGIKDAINASSAGVRATVLNDGTGYRLVLDADGTGSSNRITVTVDEDGDGTYEEAAETDTSGLSRLAFNATYDAAGAVTGGVTNLTQSRAAVDAVLKINGLDITKTSNTINDVITGVTIELKDNSKDDAGTPQNVTLSISKNMGAITANVNDFVSKYNTAMKTVVSLSVPDKDQAKIFTGDYTTRGIMQSLRSIITTAFSGNSLSMLGVGHDVNDTLTFDASTLTEALDDDFDGTLASIEAMAESLEDTIENLIDERIPTRTDGLKKSVSLLVDRISGAEVRLATVQQTYLRKFQALEIVLSELQTSTNFLTTQLASIADINGAIMNRSR